MDSGADVELSVLIPVRNGAGTLGAQLDALLAQSWAGAWEIVLADNGSTDGTHDLAQTVAQKDARVRIVSVEGRGAGAVRNAAVGHSEAAAFAFCDADDVVGPHWVAAMGEALREHDAVTGPLIVDTLNPAWLVRTRGEPSPTEPMTFHGIFPIMPAGNFGMRRAAWDKLGGFDTEVIANEDAELSMRAWQSGIAVTFVPEAAVNYRYRAEARVLFDQGRRYGTYRALVARRARDAGVPGVPRVAGWRSWLTLLRWLPRVRTAEGRASLCWVAGVRCGVALGAVRYRVLYL